MKVEVLKNQNKPKVEWTDYCSGVLFCDVGNNYWLKTTENGAVALDSGVIIRSAEAKSLFNTGDLIHVASGTEILITQE